MSQMPHADMDESENSHHADSMRDVDTVHPIDLVSVDHVNLDAGSQKSSALPHTKISPCKVLVERLRSPNQSPPNTSSQRTKRKTVIESDEDDIVPTQSPPVGVRSSRSTKRKPIIESDEEDIAPTPKRMPSWGSMSKDQTCTDSSEDRSGSDDDSDADVPGAEASVSERPSLSQVNTNMSDLGFHLAMNQRRRLRETNEYLRCLEESLSHTSKHHIDNTCNNMARLMKWYSSNKNPDNFTLADVANMDKLCLLSTVLGNSLTEFQRQLGYFKALEYFVSAIKSSTKYMSLHSFLKNDLKQVKKEVKTIKKRLNKNVNRRRTQKMTDLALKLDDSEIVVRKFNEGIEKHLRPRVKKIIEKVDSNPKIGKEEPLPVSDLMKVNAFFLALFVRYAQGPAVFLRMLLRQYIATKKTQAVTTSGGLAALGPCKILLTTEHKTGDSDIAFVPIPVAEEWQWL